MMTLNKEKKELLNGDVLVYEHDYWWIIKTEIVNEKGFSSILDDGGHVSRMRHLIKEEEVKKLLQEDEKQRKIHEENKKKRKKWESVKEWQESLEGHVFPDGNKVFWGSITDEIGNHVNNLPEKIVDDIDEWYKSAQKPFIE